MTKPTQEIEMNVFNKFCVEKRMITAAKIRAKIIP
jgi:hypothetical protein